MATFFQVVWRRRRKALNLPELGEYTNTNPVEYSQAISEIKANRIKFDVKHQHFPAIAALIVTGVIAPTPATPEAYAAVKQFKTEHVTKLQTLPIATLSVAPVVFIPPPPPEAYTLPKSHKVKFDVKLQTLEQLYSSPSPAVPPSYEATKTFRIEYNTKLQTLPIATLVVGAVEPATLQAYAAPQQFTTNFEVKLQTLPVATHSVATVPAATLQAYAAPKTFKSEFSVNHLTPLELNTYPSQTPSQVNVSTTQIWPTHKVSFKQKLQTLVDPLLRPPDAAVANPWSVCVDTAIGGTLFWSSADAFSGGGESKGSEEGDGVVISSDGQVVLVKTEGTGSSPRGNVYVLVRGVSGFPDSDVATQTITPPGSNSMALSGKTIALSADGGSLFLGAEQEDTTANNSGAVYEYIKSAATWALANIIKSDTPIASEFMGDIISVSDDGSTVAAFAVGLQGANLQKIYIFEKIGGVWTQLQKITPTTTSNSFDEDFSLALSRDGLGLIIGQHDQVFAHDAGGLINYYERASVGVAFTHKALITGAGLDYIGNEKFGISVGISDDRDVIVVGAHRDQSSDGSVRVFKGSGAVWVESQVLKRTATGKRDFLGRSVAISGDGSKIIAGAPEYDASDDGSNIAGGVWVWEEDRSGVYQETEVIENLQDNPDGDQLGSFVAISMDGKTLALGAPFSGSSADPNGGETHIVTEGTDWDCEDSTSVTWTKV